MLKVTWEPQGRNVTQIGESDATSKGSSNILKDETVLTSKEAREDGLQEHEHRHGGPRRHSLV